MCVFHHEKHIPNHGFDVVFVYGIQRNKVLLSARSRRENLHIGLALSKEFPDGQAGGHRGMAGGQILLSSLGFDELIKDEEHHAVLSSLTHRLETLFSSEDQE